MSAAPYGQRPRETNGFAIAALVLGIVAVIPLAIVFGAVALRQIKRSGEGGRGLAIAGLSLATVWTAAVVVLVVVIANDVVGRDDAGRIDHAGLIREQDVVPGDCVEAPVRHGLLDGVPCDEPHTAEAYAHFNLAGSAYEPLNHRRRASAGCLHRFEARYGIAAQESGVDVIYLRPTGLDWAIGHRDVLCFVDYGSEQRGTYKPDPRRRSPGTI